VNIRRPRRRRITDGRTTGGGPGLLSETGPLRYVLLGGTSVEDDLHGRRALTVVMAAGMVMFRPRTPCCAFALCATAVSRAKKPAR